MARIAREPKHLFVVALEFLQGLDQPPREPNVAQDGPNKRPRDARECSLEVEEQSQSTNLPQGHEPHANVHIEDVFKHKAARNEALLEQIINQVTSSNLQN